MRKQTLLKSWLLLFAIIAGVGNVWGQEEETIASFSSSSHEGWTITNAEYATAGGGYYKLISSDASIVSPSINWSNYTDITITISARKFGGPDATQGKISVSQGTKELASYSPAGTSIASSGALSIEPTDGTITISCPGASSGKGCGVQSIVIKGTPSSGTPKTPIATIGDISLSEIEVGEGSIPLAGLLAYITFAEGKTVTDCVPTITSDDTSVLEISISGTNLAYNAKKAGQATLTLTLTPTDTENYSAVSKQLTVTVVDPNAGNESWVLTDLADLTEDDVFVIVGDNGSNYAMSNNNGTTSAPSVVAVTVSDGKITSTVADNIKWNISGDATDGYTFYPDGETETWLYCTNTNNGVRVGTNENNTFTVNEDYLFNTATSRYIGIYSDNSVAKDWRCYTTINSNITGQTFAFYKKVTGDVTVPSITASNVEIAYDATEGAISYTINNPAEDGELTAEVTEGSWLTLGTVGETVPFTATANDGAERTATVKLTYTYNSTETVTKTVTVTQEGNPSLIMTIAQVRAQGTGSVKTKGVVTSCVGTTGYIQDATAAICVYGASLTVGNEITVEGTLTTYNGLLEITSPDVEVLSSGNTVNPEVMTIAEINASTKQGWLVKIENATVTAISDQNTTIAQGENTIVVRGITGVEYEVGDVLTLTGNIGCYNVAQIANPTDVTVTVNEEASIEVKETAINVTAEGAEGTITVTYNNITDVEAEVYFCDADGNAATYDWLTASINTDNNIEYLVEANDGEARTAYLKVYGLDDDANDVYSELITITQAAYVAPPTPVAGYYEKVTSTADITDGQYLIVYEEGSVAFNGGLDSGSMDAESNTIEVKIEDNQIAANTVTKAAEFTLAKENEADTYTIKSASGFYIGQSSDSNGMKIDAAKAYSHSVDIDDNNDADLVSNSAHLRYNAASNQLRFRYYKSASYTGQKAIQLYKFVAIETETLAPAYEYTTYCSSDKALDFSNVDGLEAYIVTKVNEASVSTEKVTKVPVGAGVILKKIGDANSFDIPVIADAEELEDNLLIGTVEETKIGNVTGFTDYILYEGAFHASNAGTLAAGKAYLRVEDGGQAPALGLDFNGEGTTGINSVERGALSVEGCYTLDGRRVAQPTKGLYIVNGKKVMVK